MTFSIVGRCERTGQLGVAISSSSIAVGARCPWVRAGVGVVSTQNITLPALGPRVLDLLEQGADPQAALRQALDDGSWPQYRQVTVVDAQGRTGVFSGSQALGIFTSAVGRQCVAAGNLLVSERTIEAMVPAFERSADLPLAERLLAAMQAAMAAGGEGRARAFGRAQGGGRAQLAHGGPARGLVRARSHRRAARPLGRLRAADAGLPDARHRSHGRAQLRSARR